MRFLDKINDNMTVVFLWFVCFVSQTPYTFRSLSIGTPVVRVSWGSYCVH